MAHGILNMAKSLEQCFVGLGFRTMSVIKILGFPFSRVYDASDFFLSVLNKGWNRINVSDNFNVYYLAVVSSRFFLKNLLLKDTVNN